MSSNKITQAMLEVAKKVNANRPVTDAHVSSDRVKWPVPCTVGPGLEGAIACETRIGFVNGSEGTLVYQGYDVLDLCAHSTFETPPAGQ